MAFLNINGVDVEVATANGAEVDPEVVGGGLVRAADASLRDNFQDEKTTFKASTTLMASEDALFLAALLQQKQDHWAFLVDLLSDKGLAPSSSTLATVGAGGPWAHGQLSLGATTGQVTYPSVFGAMGGTLQVARFESGAWHEYQVVVGTVSTNYACAAVYKDAVAQATAYPSWLVVTGAGTVQLKNTTGSPVLYGELVFTNAPTTSQTLATSLYAFRTGFFPPLAPNLTCSGDWNPIPLTMLSNPGAVKYVAGATIQRTVTLDLREV